MVAVVMGLLVEQVVLVAALMVVQTMVLQTQAVVEEAVRLEIAATAVQVSSSCPFQHHDTQA